MEVGISQEKLIISLSTQKEALSIETALSICLLHWHKDSETPSVNGHITIVEELRAKMRDVGIRELA